MELQAQGLRKFQGPKYSQETERLSETDSKSTAKTKGIYSVSSSIAPAELFRTRRRGKWIQYYLMIRIRFSNYFCSAAFDV